MQLEREGAMHTSFLCVVISPATQLLPDNPQRCWNHLLKANHRWRLAKDLCHRHLTNRQRVNSVIREPLNPLCAWSTTKQNLAYLSAQQELVRGEALQIPANQRQPIHALRVLFIDLRPWPLAPYDH